MFKTVKNRVNRLPGAYETSRAVMGSLLSNDRFNRSDDYVSNLSERYKQLELANINKAAGQIVKPKNLTWMIVGDKAEIVKQLKDIDLGKTIFMDTDGNVLEE